MKVRGQRFYNMQTHEKLKFGLPDVVLVSLEECDVEVVDIETMQPVSTEKLFLVIVILSDGVYGSTKPLKDQDYAAYIASTLSERLENFHKGS